MFREDNKTPATMQVTLDGRSTSLRAGVSVAAALLAKNEIISRRSPSSGKSCAPHCLMGVCHECLMEIDGVQKQSCLTEVTEGMIINRKISQTGSERE